MYLEHSYVCLFWQQNLHEVSLMSLSGIIRCGINSTSENMHSIKYVVLFPCVHTGISVAAGLTTLDTFWTLLKFLSLVSCCGKVFD